MDSRTIRYYNENAESVFARYQSVPSPVERYFRIAFPPGVEVLDVGAGSGRDLAELIREGYAAWGVEPSESLRRLAIERNPSLETRLTDGSLPDVSARLNHKFDGILCSAIFMHIPEEQLFDAACDIRNLLKPHGRLLLSIPRTRTDVGDDQRDAQGRLFVPLVPESIQLLFERVGFQRIGRWEDEDFLARPGFTWTTLLFELTSEATMNVVNGQKGEP
jgi:SAM-dependent methyltransferase